MPRVLALLAAGAALVTGCGGTGSVAGESHQAGPESKGAIALRTAVAASATLDRQYPHAHESTEVLGLEGTRVSYNAAALTDGWAFQFNVFDKCPAGTIRGAICGHQRDVYVVVRGGRAQIIHEAKGRGVGSPTTIHGEALADCRSYQCTPESHLAATCHTCARIGGVPITVAGNGWTFQLKTNVGIGFDLFAPPGRYTVTPGSFAGMHPRSRSVVLTVTAPTPELLFIRR
jgi:hypothetical protein